METDKTICVGVVRTAYVCPLVKQGDDLSQRSRLLKISPDGLKLFCICTASPWIHIYDLTANYFRLERRIKHGGFKFPALAVASDHRTLFTSSLGNSVREWRNDVMVRQLRGHSSPVSALCLSNDDQTLYSGSDYGEIKVWNVGDIHAPCVCTLHRQVREITSLVCSTDGLILCSGSADGTAIIWKQHMKGGYECIFEAPCPVNGDTVSSLFLSLDHSLFVGYNNGIIHQWDLTVTKTGWWSVRPFQNSDYSVSALCGVDNTLFSASGKNGMIIEWDMLHYPQHQTFGLRETPNTKVHTMALTPDGRSLFSCSARESCIRQWLFLDAHFLAIAIGGGLPPVLCGLVLQFLACYLPGLRPTNGSGNK